MVLNNVPKFHKILIKTIQLRNHVLKGATIKGKNMLPGSIFFPLREAPMRIENKGH